MGEVAEIGALEADLTGFTGVAVAPVSVAAGFPSPAQDYFTGRVDLNKHLIKDITCTFLVRVAGHSMEGAGISDGDEVLVDRSLTPVDGDIVVAVIDGDMTIKRLRLDHGRVRLAAENAGYPDIVISELSELSVWGVVTLCLHHVYRRQ
ncbi:translesion error-prone DNA polymerase V autoproteolytic subunit [Arthrobacter methylotrophus]|uniref:LexA family protein n=1 Tax=Arthrobacter methylotrophus TaxID=121291 RepID=A0ABV5UND6_9MICC